MCTLIREKKVIAYNFNMNACLFKISIMNRVSVALIKLLRSVKSEQKVKAFMLYVFVFQCRNLNILKSRCIYLRCRLNIWSHFLWNWTKWIEVPIRTNLCQRGMKTFFPFELCWFLHPLAFGLMINSLHVDQSLKIMTVIVLSTIILI